VILCRVGNVTDDLHDDTEVVLSVLLSKFKFEMSDKEIVWEMSDLSVPTVKGQQGIRQMPLKIIPL
jgi:hypothetical protein